jgi:SSS family solute:Na+ symporter
MDFIKKLKPDMTQAKMVQVGRVTTFAFMIVSALWAPFIKSFPSLWEYLQMFLAYISPPFVAAFVIGIFWKKATSSGAFGGLVIGHLSAVTILLLSPVLGILEIQFLMVAPILFVISTGAIIFISMNTKAPDFDQIKELIWTKALFDIETQEMKGLAWYKNYRYQSAALLTLTAIIVITFW